MLNGAKSVVVGAPLRHRHRLYNCAVVVHRGRVLVAADRMIGGLAVLTRRAALLPEGTTYLAETSDSGDAVMVRDLEFIYCPWHQWGFELATGTTAVKPEWSIRTYPVRVVGDDVLVMA